MAAVERHGGPARSSAASEPVRFGGWSDYGEWADHDFRERGPSEEPVANGQRPIVVEVMTAVVPITLPEEREDDIDSRTRCRIAAVGEDVPPGAAYLVEVDELAELIRPYLGSGIHTDNRYDLTLETMIETVRPYATLPVDAFGEDQRAVYRLCSTPQSVAEIAVAIGAPIGLTQMLVCDGIDKEYLRVHSTATPTVNGLPPIELLRRVHRGLSRLA